MGGALDRAGVLAARDIRWERVDVPEWGNGAFVYLKALSVEDTRKLSSTTATQEGTRFYGYALCLSMCDEHGAPLLDFPDSVVPLLENNTLGTIERLYRITERLSGLGTKEREDAEKNSSATPPTDSPSSLH